jgi:membrane protease YdiL (CAAX protease family)
MYSTRVTRYLSFAEGAAFASLIAWYIWRLQFTHPNSWLAFPVWLVLSFALHRDTPKTLGWRADNLWPATKQAAAFLGGCILALCAAGIYLGAWHRMPAHFIEPHRFVGYFSFCLLQQIALNSYLMNRLLSAIERPWVAALASSMIFAALHWPNPVLVPLTLAAGFAMCWLFARERNIIPLTLGQAVLGGLVWWAFPIAWHHSMRVGPGYYAFSQQLW